jgi:hypothetical protein
VVFFSAADAPPLSRDLECLRAHTRLAIFATRISNRIRGPVDRRGPQRGGGKSQHCEMRHLNMRPFGVVACVSVTFYSRKPVKPFLRAYILAPLTKKTVNDRTRLAVLAPHTGQRTPTRARGAARGLVTRVVHRPWFSDFTLVFHDSSRLPTTRNP